VREGWKGKDGAEDREKEKGKMSGSFVCRSVPAASHWQNTGLAGPLGGTKKPDGA